MIEHQLTQAKNSQSPHLRLYLDNLRAELTELDSTLDHNINLEVPALPLLESSERPVKQQTTPHDGTIE